MNKERFQQIVEAYGVEPLRWPKEERQSAESYLKTNQEASRLISEHQILDARLDSYQLSFAANLEKRIIHNILGRQSDWFSSLVNWLVPSSEQDRFLFWRPALAVSVLFCAGIFIGANIGNDVGGDTDNITLMWEDEAYLISLSTESEQ